MLIFAYIKSILSKIKSRHKRKHIKKQKYAKNVAKSISSITGKNENETFARRIAYLRKIDPLVFEELVLDAFEKKGFLIERNARYTGDGGLDGKVYRDNVWHGVQCKRYKSAIHTLHLDHFYSDLNKFNLKSGYFIHTGTTPEPAKNKYKNIKVISGKMLINLLIEKNEKQ